MGFPDLSFLGAVGSRNIQDVFGDPCYFYKAVDTSNEARGIVSQCYSEAVEALLLDEAARRFLDWNTKRKPAYDRRKRLRRRRCLWL